MGYQANKKADLTAAEIAARLGNDNRSVVVTPDPANAGNVIVASGLLPDGEAVAVGDDADPQVFTDVANAFDEGPPAVAAYGDNLDPAADALAARVPVLGPLDKTTRRTGYRHGPSNPYDASKVAFGAKHVFVNSDGVPLKADGTPIDKAAGEDLDDAADADTDTLTDEGESVYNWAQVNRTDGSRTGLPGVYDVEPRQTSLYAPYVGWTAQMTARADGT